MKLDTRVCDNCGKRRDNDTNHWLQVWSSGHGVACIAPFLSNRGDADDACGQECTTAMLSRFLATGSFARKPAGEAKRLASGEPR